MPERQTLKGGWEKIFGCVAVGAVLCVPLYFILTFLGGLLSWAESSYWAAHRTPVRFVLPKGFRGKGEIDFNVADGSQMEWAEGAIVFRIPHSGRLRLQTSYEAVPDYRDVEVYLDGIRIPSRRSNGDDEKRGAVRPSGIGFYDTMNDDANPANHYDDANRDAFFVGTHQEFVQGVKAGKIKAWE